MVGFLAKHTGLTASKAIRQLSPIYVQQLKFCTILQNINKKSSNKKQYAIKTHFFLYAIKTHFTASKLARHVFVKFQYFKFEFIEISTA